MISFLIRFSGIKASDLENVEHTLEDAQRAVSRLISWDCFIVGHSLESDLHALKVGVATVTCHHDAVTCLLSRVELLIITLWLSINHHGNRCVITADTQECRGYVSGIF